MKIFAEVETGIMNDEWCFLNPLYQFALPACLIDCRQGHCAHVYISELIR